MRVAWRIQKFDADGKHPHRFRVRASNGRIVCQSEGYSSRRRRDDTVNALLYALAHGVGEAAVRVEDAPADTRGAR